MLVIGSVAVDEAGISSARTGAAERLWLSRLPSGNNTPMTRVCLFLVQYTMSAADGKAEYLCGHAGVECPRLGFILECAMEFAAAMAWTRQQGL